MDKSCGAMGQGADRLCYPLLGQHMLEIVAGYGIAPERIAQLKTAAVIADSAPAVRTTAEKG